MPEAKLNGVEIRDKIVAKDLAALYAAVGWEHRQNLDYCAKALEHTPVVFGAYAQKKLIGAVRVATDYTFFAHIIDIAVHPDFQHKDLGGQLLQCVIRFCREHGFEEQQGELTLFAAHKADRFFSIYNFHLTANGMYYQFRHLRRERTTQILSRDGKD